MSDPTHQPTPSSRNWGRLSGAVGAIFILLCAAAYSAWWWLVANEFKAGIEKWQVDSARAGVLADWQSLDVSGFPGVIQVTIAEPVVASPDGYEWSTAEAQLHLRPWVLTAINLVAPGTHALSVPTQQGKEAWTLEASTLQGVARAAPEGGTVNIEIGNGLIRQDGEDVSRLTDLTATLFRPAPAASDADALNPPAGFDVAISASHEDLRNTIDWPFDDRVQHTDIRAIVYGDLRLPVHRDHVSAWRDQGGSLDLTGFSSRIGPLRLVGDGTVSLDHALQPIGAMSISLTGYDTILNMLVRDGRVPAENAGIIRGLLDLLAKRSGSTGDKTIDVSLSVQDSRLYLGPFEIGALPPMRWPE